MTGEKIGKEQTQARLNPDMAISKLWDPNHFLNPSHAPSFLLSFPRIN